MEKITRHGVTAPLAYHADIDRFHERERITNARYYEIQDLVDQGVLTREQQLAYANGEFELPGHEVSS